MNIVDHVRDGARTFRIAARAGITTPQARRLLMAAEEQRLVQRDARYSAVNDTFWVAVEPRDS